MGNATIPRTLTETELEIMQILWELGEGGVRDVMGKLPPDRALAYTSVATMLRILEVKGFVERRKEGKSHRYVPYVNKSDYERFFVERVVERVFAGTPSALVKHLVETPSLDQAELEKIRQLIDNV